MKVFNGFVSKKYLMQAGKACAAISTLAVTAVAHAALPAAATTAFTTIQEDGLDLIDLAWPVAIAITGGFILLKLFKRGARAAV